MFFSGPKRSCVRVGFGAVRGRAEGRCWCELWSMRGGVEIDLRSMCVLFGGGSRRLGSRRAIMGRCRVGLLWSYGDLGLILTRSGPTLSRHGAEAGSIRGRSRVNVGQVWSQCEPNTEGAPWAHRILAQSAGTGSDGASATHAPSLEGRSGGRASSRIRTRLARIALSQRRATLEPEIGSAGPTTGGRRLA